jgi:hypothetical protein
MKKILSSLLLVVPTILMAHPGHGETEGFTITHYFTEVQHVLISIALISITAVTVWYIKNRKKQKA